jgi:hypothetical protein
VGGLTPLKGLNGKAESCFGLADEGLRRWEERYWVGLPPYGPVEVLLLEGAWLTLAVTERLASSKPMSMVIAQGGCGLRGAWRSWLPLRGWWGVGRGGRPHQLVGNGL